MQPSLTERIDCELDLPSTQSTQSLKEKQSEIRIAEVGQRPSRLSHKALRIQPSSEEAVDCRLERLSIARSTERADDGMPVALRGTVELRKERRTESMAELRCSSSV